MEHLLLFNRGSQMLAMLLALLVTSIHQLHGSNKVFFFKGSQDIAVCGCHMYLRDNMFAH